MCVHVPSLLSSKYLAVNKFIPERYLQVLSTPDVHLHVVFAQLVEVLPVHAEESAGYHRSSDHLSGVGEAGAPLSSREVLPLEMNNLNE